MSAWLRAIVFLLFVALSATIASAQFPTPRLRAVYPAGARQGAVLETVIEGENLDEPERLYFSHPGLKSEKVEAQKGEKARFKVTVGRDVPAGYYDLRIIAKRGASNPRTFVVGERPETEEVEPNEERAQATRVEFGGTVNGKMQKTEDVDWFVFAGKKGDRVLIECTAWRIDSRFDGYLFLFDPEGRELAASQDENIRDQMRDPFIDVVLPADGEYSLKLTDFMYAGGSDYFYRLTIGNGPYVDFVTPTGIRPGEKKPITLFGRNLPGGRPAGIDVKGRPLEALTIDVTAPADPAQVDGLSLADVVRPQTSQLAGFEVSTRGPQGASNGKLLVFSDVEEVLENEANDTPETAQLLQLPCAVSGRFLTNDLDWFVFLAQKNRKYAIEVIAQRLGSPADPDLEILKPNGGLAQSLADDNQNIGQIRFYTNGRDIRALFTASEDGDFRLRLEHLYRAVQGGPQYAYRLVVRPDPQPDFRLVCQPAEEVRMDSHLVLRGGRARLDMLVWRLDGHNGEIRVEARGLPKGVTADPIVIGPGVNWGTLVVSAAADAEIADREFEIVGTSDLDGVKRDHRARGGVIVWDTVNTPAISRQTRSMVLSVREGAPFALAAKCLTPSVEQGKPIELTVDVARLGEMKNAVQLVGAGYQLPPKLAIPTTNVAPGATQAKLSIDSTQIPPGTYSFLVNGDGQVPVKQADGSSKNVRCVYPSNTVTVTVTAAPAAKK
jgi:hypothetical protein